MKIVLRQDVPNVGEAGTIQNVSTGYARNFLIPKLLAVVATEGEVKNAEHNQAVKMRKVAKQEASLQSLADRIDGTRIEFIARTGDQGRLYGSITSADIAAKLAEAVGEEVDRRKVILDDPLRTVGEHGVTVHLVGRLRPRVTVVITSENAEDPAEEAVETVSEAVEGEPEGDENA